MTIRLRLTLWFVALLGALMVARSVFIVGTMYKALNDDAISDARGKASQVRDFIEDLDLERRSEGTRTPLPLSDPEALPRAFYDDGMLVQLTDNQGHIVQRSANLGSFTLPVLLRRSHETVSLPLPHLFFSSKVLVAAEPLFVRGHKIGAVQVGRALQYSVRTLYKLLEIELSALVTGLLLAFGAGYWLAGLVLRPVSRMTDEVNRMQATDLHHRLAVPNPPTDEIETLGATFNRLFDRLEGAFEAQRRFVADASHELKSPLTAIRGHAQLVIKRGADNPDRLSEWAGTIVRESDRLSRLVGELLMLAKGDHGVDQVTTDVINLGSLAQEVAQALRNVHPKVQEVEADAQPVMITGSADRMRQVLINLLDNAVRATQQKGHVTVRVHAENGQAVLSIADTGCGISSEHLERIFDRFYRVDAARDRAGGGTGLGLAIVESIVRAHGGTILVTSEPNVGTTFTLTLPLASVEKKKSPGLPPTGMLG